MKTVPLLALTALLTVPAATQAAVQTKSVKYSVDGTEMVGFMAWDDASKEKRPGVLVVHEWWGLNDYAKLRTRQLAEMGYVAFAVDMYGGGKVTRDPKQAGEWAGKVRKEDPTLMRQRVRAGFEQLKKSPMVDATKTAAIGFCFGGTTVLQLAYSGADVDGVVSFHGGLQQPQEGDAEIRSKLLVLHGEADPHVPPAQVEGWKKAVDAKQADWQLVAYAGALHAFTNPAAVGEQWKKMGVHYDAEAARRSWAHMRVFFDELFRPRAWKAADPNPK